MKQFAPKTLCYQVRAARPVKRLRHVLGLDGALHALGLAALEADGLRFMVMVMGMPTSLKKA